MMYHQSMILQIVLLLLYVVRPIDAFPGAAGHCDSGDLSGKFSGHGEFGGGPLTNGSLRVKIGTSILQTFTAAQLNANQLYTVTLEFTTSSPSFFFRGFLFRLSGQNGENVEGTLSVGSDGNVQLKSGCDDGISAVTHTNRLDKTSMTFEFEYTESLSANLFLEVTVVRERARDNWFYSGFNIQIGDGGSSETDAPTLSPVSDSSETNAPSVTVTSGPGPTNAPTASPTASLTSSPTASPNAIAGCTDSPLRFRTVNKRTGKFIWRDCKWAGNKSTNYRCTFDSVMSMCPVTCDVCQNYFCWDADGRFKVDIEGERKARDCNWVGTRATAVRCRLSGVLETCPNTCDTSNC